MADIQEEVLSAFLAQMAELDGITADFLVDLEAEVRREQGARPAELTALFRVSPRSSWQSDPNTICSHHRDARHPQPLDHPALQVNRHNRAEWIRKSGVVDAVEFALTGDMSRLSGKETGGVTVTRHGPTSTNATILAPRQ